MCSTIIVSENLKMSEKTKANCVFNDTLISIQSTDIQSILDVSVLLLHLFYYFHVALWWFAFYSSSNLLSTIDNHHLVDLHPICLLSLRPFDFFPWFFQSAIANEKQSFALFTHQVSSSTKFLIDFISLENN